MTTLEKNLIDEFITVSKGKPESFFNKNLAKLYDLSKSEEMTKKLLGRTLYSTNDTFIYKGAEMIKGWTDTSIKFIDAVKVEPNKPVGKIKAIFYKRENSATNFPNYQLMPYVLLDYPDYFRVVPFANKFVTLEGGTSGGGGGTNGGGVTPPDNTKDTTKDTTKETGTKLKPMVIVGGLGVLIGVYLLFSGK